LIGEDEEEWGGTTLQNVGEYFKGYEEFEEQKNDDNYYEDEDEFDFGGSTLAIGSYFVEEHEEYDE